ncbi:MAG: DNA internalization-related competence protein ComEC/Rec2 [Lachnospiraceae bacterium]|nr:DNA internalization-related competence protein ComEC/Rec2 [Lachnospiraceae bacterium]
MAEKRPVVFVVPALVLGEVDAILGMHGILLLLCIPYIMMQKVTTKKKEIFFVVIFLLFLVGKISVLSEERKVQYFSGEVVAIGTFSHVESTSVGYRYYLKNVEVVKVKDGTADKETADTKTTDVRKNYTETSDGEKGYCIKKNQKNNYDEVVVYTNKKNIYYPGNKVCVEGSIKKYESAANPGNMDLNLYYKTLGRYGYIKEKKSEGLNNNVNHYVLVLFELKNKMMDAVSKMSQECEEKYIITAILTGEKNQIDEEMKSLYMAGGISHIIAISGIHITAIGIAIYKLLRKKFKFIISGSGSLFVVISFVIMTGEQVSAVRAVIMFVFYILANVLGRRYDMANAVSFTVIIMCIFKPFIIMNFSFQMSVGAIFSIIYVYPVLCKFLGVENKDAFKIRYVNKRCIQINSGINRKDAYEIVIVSIEKIKIQVIKSLIASISINLVTLPVVTYYYFQYSRLSVVVNVIVVLMMSFVVMFSFISVLLSLIIGNGNWISDIIISPVLSVLKTFTFVCRKTAIITGNVCVTGRPKVWQIIIYYSVLIVLLYGVHLLKNIREKEKKTTVRVFRGISIGAIYLILPILLCRFDNNNGIIVNNVGQGDCIVVCDKSANLMIDCGSSDVEEVYKYRVKSALKARRIDRIDYFFVSHADSDHYSGLLEMLNDSNPDSIKIGKIVVADIIDKDSDLWKKIESEEERIIFIGEGDAFKLENLTVECLYPGKNINAEDENSKSLILKITQNGSKYLFTGDIPMKCEGEFIDRIQEKYDVLKVAHHGSKDSTSMEFLERTGANIFLISCGKNNRYGHPHKELVERIRKCRGKIYVTSRDGQIIVKNQ